MKKKGVEMSLNVIIVAAIGLLILVILAFLVVNYVGKFQKGAESCVANGGLCQAAACTTNPALTGTFTDCDGTPAGEGRYCCKVVRTS